MNSERKDTWPVEVVRPRYPGEKSGKILGWESSDGAETQVRQRGQGTVGNRLMSAFLVRVTERSTTKISHPHDLGEVGNLLSTCSGC